MKKCCVRIRMITLDDILFNIWSDFCTIFVMSLLGNWFSDFGSIWFTSTVPWRFVETSLFCENFRKCHLFHPKHENLLKTRNLDVCIQTISIQTHISGGETICILNLHCWAGFEQQFEPNCWVEKQTSHRQKTHAF